MNVILVGTGNVAVVLSQLLVAAGHSIVEVHGRNAIMLNQISQLTGAEVKTNIFEINKNADLCLIAVSDRAISEVASQLQINKMLVVHTSGATSKEILNRFENYGVLYPLQSLRKEMKRIPPIPFFADANTKHNLDVLFQLASSTGNNVSLGSDEERLKFHIAAVFCSNFTNHLYALTESFCQTNNINFKNLLPLINETAVRLQNFPAEQMQTGPAVRHDDNTIERHLTMLQPYHNLGHIYQVLTKSIQDFSKKQD